MKFTKVDLRPDRRYGDETRRADIPAGWHKCIIVSARHNAQKQSYVIGFGVLAPGKPYHGAGFTGFLKYDNEEALKRLGALAKAALFIDVENEDWELDHNQLVGKILSVEVEQRTFENKSYTSPRFGNYKQWNTPDETEKSAILEARAEIEQIAARAAEHGNDSHDTAEGGGETRPAVPF